MREPFLEGFLSALDDDVREYYGDDVLEKVAIGAFLKTPALKAAKAAGSFIRGLGGRVAGGAGSFLGKFKAPNVIKSARSRVSASLGLNPTKAVSGAGMGIKTPSAKIPTSPSV